jgi:integrase/recombinase XerD
MTTVPTIRIPETAPHVVTDEEFAAMLRASAGTAYTERRDTALLRLLESTGCRRGEIATAKVEGLNLPTQTLAVIGKGNKPRTVAFDDETSNALHHYIRVRARHRHARRPELFLGPSGAMPPIAIYEMVKRRATQAGCPNVTTHAFRHRWAHLAKASGAMSDEHVKALGGWSSSVYLEKYGRASTASRAVASYQRWKRGGEARR